MLYIAFIIFKRNDVFHFDEQYEKLELYSVKKKYIKIF